MFINYRHYGVRSVREHISLVWFYCYVTVEPFALSAEDIANDQPRFVSQQLSNVEDNPQQLRVMAWNIKYGAMRLPFWFDCWGDQVSIPAAQVETNMEAIYEMIREANPDILMVEEIELHSRRSAYYDMIQGILDHTELNYGAYYETWNSRYIPSEGLGRMSLGNAIFSKYPITSSEKIMQADRRDLDAVTKPFTCIELLAERKYSFLKVIQ